VGFSAGLAGLFLCDGSTTMHETQMAA